MWQVLYISLLSLLKLGRLHNFNFGTLFERLDASMMFSPVFVTILVRMGGGGWRGRQHMAMSFM